MGGEDILRLVFSPRCTESWLQHRGLYMFVHRYTSNIHKSNCKKYLSCMSTFCSPSNNSILTPHAALRYKPRALCADSPCPFSLLQHMTALTPLSLDPHRGDSRAEHSSWIPTSHRDFSLLVGLGVFHKTNIKQTPEFLSTLFFVKWVKCTCHSHKSPARETPWEALTKVAVFSPEDRTWQITQKMEADGYVSFLFVSSSLRVLQKMLSTTNRSHLTPGLIIRNARGRDIIIRGENKQIPGRIPSGTVCVIIQDSLHISCSRRSACGLNMRCAAAFQQAKQLQLSWKTLRVWASKMVN